MPTSSSTPGIESPSNASTSSRSSHVPCSMMSVSACRCVLSQRANAREASSSTACTRDPLTAVTCDDRRHPSASPSECAGSVDTMSTRAPAAPADTARAAAHVVLPTPPFPPKKMNCARRIGGTLKSEVSSVKSVRLQSSDLKLSISTPVTLSLGDIVMAPGC